MRRSKQRYGLPKPIPTERRKPAYIVELLVVGIALIVIALDTFYWRAG
jgi:hypothetical protein